MLERALLSAKSHLAFFLFLLLTTIVPEPVRAETLRFRISLENTADHVQTQAVQDFAQKLQATVGDRLRVELHHSGTLYRDADVIAALNRGQVDMAVPGTWHIGRFQPDVAVFLLPEFFGREIAFQHRHSDGPLGREVTRRIEEELGVVVPGRWFDLGHGHLFFTAREVTSHDALAGRVIRVAGGRANELRVEALGARAITVAWGDVPARLSRNQMDGLLTTHETVRTGRLWEYGVRSALEDFQYMPQYVPMIRGALWNRLDREVRDQIVQIWDEQVDRQRVAAAQAQEQSRAYLRERGIEIVSTSADDLEEIRTLLLDRQNDFARELGIDPAILDILHAGD